jgi:hypothetical protein
MNNNKNLINMDNNKYFNKYRLELEIFFKPDQLSTQIYYIYYTFNYLL